MPRRQITHTSMQYFGKSSDFVYGGIEAVEMKKCRKDQQLAVLRLKLEEQGIVAKHVSDYPAFVQAYKDVFVEGGMNDNIVTETTKRFDSLAQEHDPIFTLPSKPNLEPDV